MKYISSLLFWQVPAYIVAQVGGSTLACLVLNALFSKDGMGPTLTLPQKGISPLDAIIWEFIITFFLMFVVCGVATDERAVRTFFGSFTWYYGIAPTWSSVDRDVGPSKDCMYYLNTVIGGDHRDGPKGHMQHTTAVAPM